MQIIAVTNDRHEIVEPLWLRRAETVHRQLRPHLPPDYAAKMRSVLAGGAGMTVAAEGESVRGVAVYRWHENTAEGRKFYIDDLVTDEALRSSGVGRALLAHLESEARRLACHAIVLDSGTQRTRAHRFYFREGFFITSFNFKKQLT